MVKKWRKKKKISIKNEKEWGAMKKIKKKKKKKKMKKMKTKWRVDSLE